MRYTLSNSWALVKASGRILNEDRALLVFPLLSGIASVGLAATFIVPAFLLGGPDALFRDGNIAGYVMAFLFYLSQYFIVFFFNAALVGATLIHLEGGRPTLSDGLRIASDHAVPLLGYAAISATVGLVLNSVGRKGGLGGQIASGVFGMAWNLATFLAVPVLVTRDVGPVEALRESASLLKRSWGEQVTGTVGMGLAFGIMALGLALASAGFFALAVAVGPFGVVPAIVGIVLVWILFALAATAIQGIYRAAVYRYAVTGQGGAGFEQIPLREVVQAVGR